MCSDRTFADQDEADEYMAEHGEKPAVSYEAVPPGETAFNANAASSLQAAILNAEALCPRGLASIEVWINGKEGATNVIRDAASFDMLLQAAQPDAFE